MTSFKKKLKSFLILTLALTLFLPIAANAQAGGNAFGKEKHISKKIHAPSDGTEMAERMLERDGIEALKDATEAAKDALELDLEAALAAGDMEAAAALKEEIDGMKEEIEQLRFQMKTSLLEAKTFAKSCYSEEELLAIEEMREALSLRFKNIRTLPVQSVLARGRNLKFDTPPVIKDGRTLIPVRAVSEAFGAQVSWDPLTRMITIVKMDTTIVLEIGSPVASVNGEEVILDASSEIMNGRTVIPLRFVAESLGLSVAWDEETETVEIAGGDDPESTEEPSAEEEPVEIPSDSEGDAPESTEPSGEEIL